VSTALFVGQVLRPPPGGSEPLLSGSWTGTLAQLLLRARASSPGHEPTSLAWWDGNASESPSWIWCEYLPFHRLSPVRLGSNNQSAFACAPVAVLPAQTPLIRLRFRRHTRARTLRSMHDGSASAIGNGTDCLV